MTRFDYEDKDGWRVRGDVSRGPAGALAISRLEVWPEPGASSVTAGLLRRIPVGELLSSVRTQAVGQSDQLASVLAQMLDESPAGMHLPESTSREPLSDSLLCRVALAYLEETAPGKDRRVLKRLAERFDRPEETVRTWITRARKAGWLGAGTKGRAGAEPGPRLRQQFEQLIHDPEEIEIDLDAADSDE